MPPGKGRRNVEATPGPPDSVSTSLLCFAVSFSPCSTASSDACSVCAFGRLTVCTCLTGWATASFAATSAVYLWQLR